MYKILLSTLIVLSTLFLAATAHAQDDTVLLANAIYRVKTGENGRIAWRECGERLTGVEALTRANEYAALFTAEHTADANFDPWIGASIAMAESSLNRCAISRGAMTTFEEYLGREPEEEDILRLLQNRAYRRRAGVDSAFDAGLVQFRWPGAIATMVGVTDAGVLVDAHASIHMLAASMQHYRTACDTVEEYRGTHTVNRDDGTIRVVRYSIPCLEAYWVQHNSPSSFNYRYYSNVMRWHRELQRYSSETPIVPGDTAS